MLTKVIVGCWVVFFLVLILIRYDNTQSLTRKTNTTWRVCLSEYFHKHIKQANCVSFDSTNGLPLERHRHLAGFNVRRQCSFRASAPAHRRSLRTSASSGHTFSPVIRRNPEAAEGSPSPPTHHLDPGPGGPLRANRGKKPSK